MRRGLLPSHLIIDDGLIPEDFGERLERLKEMAGLWWREFAELLGVTQRGMLKWRREGRPSGASFWAIMELARDVPGGYELMLCGDDGPGDIAAGTSPHRPFPRTFRCAWGGWKTCPGLPWRSSPAT